MQSRSDEVESWMQKRKLMVILLSLTTHTNPNPDNSTAFRPMKAFKRRKAPPLCELPR